MNKYNLAHPLLSTFLPLKEEYISILVIENGATLAQIIQELQEQLSGSEGDFVLSQNFTPIPMPKNIELITDIFNLENNERKITTKVLEALRSYAINEDNYLQTCAIKNNLENYMSSLLLHFEYNLSFDGEIDLISIFKACKTAPLKNCDSLLEKLLEYMHIAHTLLKIPCFFLVNIKSFLSHEEIQLFYQEILYKKYIILLLESKHSETISEHEKICILDKDLCEIRIKT